MKKRTKKLLQFASGVSFNRQTWVVPLLDKSFLVLFFKKELLPCFALSPAHFSLVLVMFACNAAPAQPFPAAGRRAAANRAEDGAMMHGQLVAIEHGWALPSRRPKLRLRRHWAPTLAVPDLELGSRIVMGAVVGTACGAPTAYVGLWMVLGAVAAVVLGRLRDRAASALSATQA